MTKRHPLENQHRSGFTLLTCPVPKERSVHLSFRTFQRKGHPHPALSRSTPGHFLADFSPKTSRFKHCVELRRTGVCLQIMGNLARREFAKVQEITEVVGLDRKASCRERGEISVVGV